MNFEWDPKKNKINQKKHGISFEQAIHVFNDPNLISFYDIEHSYDEDREIFLGNIGGRLLILYVVTTQRSDAIRLISARMATKEEENFYYETNQV